MPNQGLTIAQAARSIGKSTTTIRRYIKSGKVKAELTPRKRGMEFRIFEIPPQLIGRQSRDTRNKSYFANANLKLQLENLKLGHQYRTAQYKIWELETQIKLLTRHPGDRIVRLIRQINKLSDMLDPEVYNWQASRDLMPHTLNGLHVLIKKATALIEFLEKQK